MDGEETHGVKMEITGRHVHGLMRVKHHQVLNYHAGALPDIGRISRPRRTGRWGCYTRIPRGVYLL